MSSIKVILHFENDNTPYIYEIEVKRLHQTPFNTEDSMFIPVTKLKSELEISSNYRFFISSQDDEIGSVRAEVKDTDLIRVPHSGKLEFWLIKNVERNSPGNSVCVVSTKSSTLSGKACSDGNVDLPLKSSHSSIATGYSWSNWNDKFMNKKTNCPSICTSLLSQVTSADVQIVKVQLNISPYVPVGLRFSGRVDKAGNDQGILVDSILRGGAAEIDSRISPGMLVLEVNGRSLENLSNSDSMKLLHVALSAEKKTVDLVFADFDSNDFLDSLLCDRSVAGFSGDSGTIVTPTCHQRLSLNTDMFAVVAAMMRTDIDNALPIRDRLWLKMTISSAFLGSELISWLLEHVDGIYRRKDAVSYAMNMIECGFVRDAILARKKADFSERRYYVVADAIVERLRSCEKAVSLFSDGSRLQVRRNRIRNGSL